ncbi:DEAD/DEAH box helicase [Streptomyces sp. SKN60]|uniref:DEAD/DEAH box helicase n=1 Tax=Streptomyces sp. SKN60 TaxID=2855506 RepID=UPI0027D32526|nr:DEAD/DEAH box helicase [Streptomyces sp. SKN60]MCX2183554.1 DEAD/DEAH box helicase [Streptomyces sp. SKN60]
MTLPVALSGTDVIGQAKTGTGKTLGFGLPILERVIVPADVEAGRAEPEQLTDAPQALVVVPTRELCQQVTNDLLTAGKVRNVRVLAIYGGRAYEPQVEALKKGVDVIVGTPGRLLDLAGQRKLDLSHVKALVLDEADEMLDLGFLPDVEKIINMLPAKRQTMLFSATMPGAVIGLARRYMSKPTHIRATSPDDEGATHANIAQHVFRAHNMDKPEMVARILQARGRGLAMIFCRTKRTAADIAEQLERRGFASGAVHGDLGQGAREQALRAFRNGKVDVLVATDVAARGIDVEGVTHVINYQSPEDEKTYLHRIGRTGRAGASGTAITLVDWDDIPRWQLINKALELNFSDPVETYSSSPHLYELLDIPEGTKGILPRAERTRAGLDAEVLEDLGEPGGKRGRGPRREQQQTEERPARTRTPRQRRRTRGGSELGDGAPAEQTAAPAVGTDSGTDAAEAPAGPRRPRRRRTRGTGGPSAGIPVAGASSTTAVAEAPEPVVEAPVVEAPVVEAPVAEAPVEEPRRRRSRTRTPAAATTEVAEVTEAPAAETPAVEAPAAPAEESRPRRRRSRGARPEAAEPVTAAAAAAPAPAATPAPRKRRVRPRPAEETVSFQTVETAAAALAAATARTVPAQATEPKAVEPKAAEVKAAEPKAAVPAQAAEPVTAAPAAAPSAPRARRRATRPVTSTAPTVEAPAAAEPAPAPVAEEPKPRRRATRRASSPVTSTADTGAVVIVEAAAPVAEPVVTEEPKKAAPRKRVAKKAVAAEAPAETTEAPKKAAPRKRVAKKVAETVAEAAAEVTEEPKKAAPRKRVAKKAVAAEAPDASEPKTPTRRRTTKKAVAAEAPAEAAETAPKKAAPRKRVAKKAAAQPEA